MVVDSISGASPTWYDSSSGASATIIGEISDPDDIVFGDIDYEDRRVAVGGALTTRFDSRDELTLGINYSDEYDYLSIEGSAEYMYYLDQSKNSAITIGGSYQSNEVIVRCELNTDVCDSSSGGSQKVDSEVLSLEVGFTQVLDKTSLAKASVFYIGEDGYLSNPYMRVVRNYNTNPIVVDEVKPDKRETFGGLLEYVKSFDNSLVMQLSYRYYDDDWDINSHTLNSEFYYSLNSKFLLGTGLRYYYQSAAYFYNGSKDYFTEELYASSDRRMSEYDAYNFSLMGDYKIYSDLSVNGSLNYYTQAKYFDAIYLNIGFKYSF